mmetsp:Transcript_10737/g.30451  ORF Transcript_10737/g.30451 Transcript_10737/m.30451 type:complete len:186 (-) Transcript_10737:137-694(-)
MAKRVVQVALAFGVAHTCATAVALQAAGAGPDNGAMASQHSDRQSGGEAGQRLARVVTELYRGQKRHARVPELYADHCVLETPALEVEGVENVTAFLRDGLPKLRPVQMNSRLQTNSSHVVEVAMMTQYTMPLIDAAWTVPMRVRLELDDEGKVIRHSELWQGRPLSSAFQFTRQLNGWLFNKLV